MYGSKTRFKQKPTELSYRKLLEAESSGSQLWIAGRELRALRKRFMRRGIRVPIGNSTFTRAVKP